MVGSTGQQFMRPRSLSSRLFLSYAVVLVVGVFSAGIVAAVMGPRLFHQHLIQIGQTAESTDLIHVEEAYVEASLVALGVAFAVSVAAALAVSWWITHRIRQPLSSLTQAAGELRRGHYDTRVPVTGIGAELDTLADAFNSMATRLEQTEVTRRRLLADLTHEMRTPISTLTTYHDALKDGVATMTDDVVDVLSGQTARLARLATDVAEVSLAEEGHLSLDKAPVPVRDVITEAAQSVRDQFARKRVKLVVDRGRLSGALVDVDRLRIAQVMSNVLSNALRHTPPGGSVSISATRAGVDVEVCIADTGEGMDAELQSHVFERFFRGDSARDRDRSGSGVGLTISRAIADLHGGSLTVDSDGLGHGTRVTLMLPVAGTD